MGEGAVPEPEAAVSSSLGLALEKVGPTLAEEGDGWGPGNGEGGFVRAPLPLPGCPLPNPCTPFSGQFTIHGVPSLCWTWGKEAKSPLKASALEELTLQ